MDDKIKEIMGLVDDYLDSKIKNGSYTYNEKTHYARLAIESKLRELVPVEATEAMRSAALKVPIDPIYDDRDYFVNGGDIWAAMVAAAQKEIK